MRVPRGLCLLSIAGVLPVVIAWLAVAAGPGAAASDDLAEGPDWCAAIRSRVREAAAEGGYHGEVGPPALADASARGVLRPAEPVKFVVEIKPPPARAAGRTTSMGHQAMSCGKAAVMCTLAAAWLPPAAVACYGDAVACGLTIGCAATSCLD